MHLYQHCNYINQPLGAYLLYRKRLQEESFDRYEIQPKIYKGILLAYVSVPLDFRAIR